MLTHLAMGDELSEDPEVREVHRLVAKIGDALEGECSRLAMVALSIITTLNVQLSCKAEEQISVVKEFCKMVKSGLKAIRKAA